MATLVKDPDTSVTATWPAADTGALSMGHLENALIQVQALAAGNLEGSNDGTTWATLLTFAGAGFQNTVTPRFLRGAAAHGGLIAVGWRA